MYTFKTLIATAIVAAAPGAFGAEPAQSTCSPQFVNTHTQFPSAARDLGVNGVVQVSLRLDAEGRATEAQVERSSGHQLLDQAALDSVRNHWRFEVARCSATELAVLRTVEVHFRRPARTLSGTVNRKAPAETQEMLARNRCNVARDATDTTIYSCVQNAPRDVAGKAAKLATQP